MVVDADAVLLAVFGSASLPFTVAVLVMVPAVAGAVALMVNVELAPAARLPTVQVTVPAEFVHPVLAETKVTPAGRGSVTTTPVAGPGPLLVCGTVLVKMVLTVALKRPGFVTTRSADATIVVVADAVLFVLMGPRSLTLTVVVLATVLGVAGAVALMVIVALAPEARLPTEQVTVPEALVQVPWLEDAETKVTP